MDRLPSPPWPPPRRNGRRPNLFEMIEFIHDGAIWLIAAVMGLFLEHERTQELIVTQADRLAAADAMAETNIRDLFREAQSEMDELKAALAEAGIADPRVEFAITNMEGRNSRIQQLIGQLSASGAGGTPPEPAKGNNPHGDDLGNTNPTGETQGTGDSSRPTNKVPGAPGSPDPKTTKPPGKPI